MNDPAFRSGLVLILEIALAVVLTTYVLAYLQASLLNVDFPFRRVVRTIALLPMAVPAVVVGELFGYLYDPSVGPINGLLKHLGIVKTPEFLAISGLRWMWIAIPAVWMALPFATLFLLASMQGIPKDQLEAATVDGAGWWRRFWNITFPGTRRALAAIVRSLLPPSCWPSKCTWPCSARAAALPMSPAPASLFPRCTPTTTSATV